MKNTVIQFFLNLPKEKYEQFNQAFDLYRKSEGKSPAMEKGINASGFSEGSLRNLLYDLQKLHGITDVEKMAGPDKSKTLKVASDPKNENLSTEARAISTEASAVSTELDVNNIDVVVTEMQADEPKPLAVVSAKTLRVEFPFLNEKSCPDELKILVADKISAWNDYLQCHETLRSIAAGELVTDDQSEAEIAAAAIASFEENQRIYDELVCYAESGTILGVHPIFKRLQVTREVDAMTSEELVKYKGSSAKYFTVNKAGLAKATKAKDEAKVKEINIRVGQREQKLALVNKKLGINPK